MNSITKFKNTQIMDERITLREIRKSDLSCCVEWLRDPEVTRFLSNSVKNISEEDELQWFKTVRSSRNDIVFSIISLAENRHIGNCGLHKINWLDKTCEMGIFIGDRNFWNRGFGTSAIKLLLDFAVNAIGIENIRLQVYEYNLRAKKVYEKCGFTVTETLENHHLFDNKYWDTFVMEYRKNK